MSFDQIKKIQDIKELGTRYHKIGQDYDLCQAAFQKLSPQEQSLFEQINHPEYQNLIEKDIQAIQQHCYATNDHVFENEQGHVYYESVFYSFLFSSILNCNFDDISNVQNQLNELLKNNQRYQLKSSMIVTGLMEDYDLMQFPLFKENSEKLKTLREILEQIKVLIKDSIKGGMDQALKYLSQTRQNPKSYLLYQYAMKALCFLQLQDVKKQLISFQQKFQNQKHGDFQFQKQLDLNKQIWDQKEDILFILKSKDIAWKNIIKEELLLMCLALGKDGYGICIWECKDSQKNQKQVKIAISESCQNMNSCINLITQHDDIKFSYKIRLSFPFSKKDLQNYNSLCRTQVEKKQMLNKQDKKEELKIRQKIRQQHEQEMSNKQDIQ